MMFPHNEKVVTINQLTYHELGAKGSLDNFNSKLQKKVPPHTGARFGMIKDSTLLGPYQGLPPIIPQESICVLSTE